ncbi:hypothetical protein [Micromonospora sp. NPDC049662]|uniref:hypothetical protein n=1 Tax=Micromonospora sp. NPDC049662 TaxID=3155397 RepID=UPI00343FAF20
MGRRPPGSAADVNATVVARCAVWAQLARTTELLAGRPQLAVSSRAEASTVLSGQWKPAIQLYFGLRAAAAVDRTLPPSRDTPTLEPTLSLRRAADAITVIGDILASHLPTEHQPGTPEGQAIRAGAGVQSGLADIAQLALNAVAIDIALPGWLDHTHGYLGEIYRPAAEAAEWTSGSGLSAVARELVALGSGHPRLRGLDVARSPMYPVPMANSVEDAIAAIRAARTWLWQNPRELTGVHLQLGTQLGLAIHVLARQGRPKITSEWRSAAIAAADLRTGTPMGLAMDAGGELAEALRWLRSHDQRDPDLPHPINDQQGFRLTWELPFLAAALHQGLTSALDRRDLFVKSDGVLVRPAGSLVFRVVRNWRPAVRGDVVVQDLTHALLRAQDDGKYRNWSSTAFPSPPRPKASLSQPPPSRASPPSAEQTRRRTR